MAKARSPRYPVIGLKEAIEKVEMVYTKDHQNTIPKRVVAEHMGYGSLNGKSLGIISAASKYGLLEGRAEEMRVSDEALSILANPPGSAERAASVCVTAEMPDLFVELNSRFPGGNVSDSAIKSYLLTQKKFLPRAVDVVIRSYRETMDFVNGEVTSATLSDKVADPSSYDEKERERVIGSGYGAQRLSAVQQKGHEAEVGGHGSQTLPYFQQRGGDVTLSEQSSFVHSRSKELPTNEILNSRLTKHCTVELRFHGPVTAGAIDKLIWYLEGTREAYPEDTSTVSDTLDSQNAQRS